MASKIYLFSFDSNKSTQTETCVSQRLSKLYDIKHVHNTVYFIKTVDDVHLLEKYLSSCFDNNTSYFLVNITDQQMVTLIQFLQISIAGWIIFKMKPPLNSDGY